jgi:hypothetical protein
MASANAGRRVKDRRRLFARSYSVTWAILLAAFAGVGAYQIWIGPSEATVVRNTPFASSDAYFEALFDVRDGSQRCLDVMRRVYGKGTVVYFCAKHDTRGALGFGLVSYLASPQEMRRVEVERNELRRAVAAIDRATTAAVIFANVQAPPEFAHGWQIGPRILVVPHDQLP